MFMKIIFLIYADLIKLQYSAITFLYKAGMHWHKSMKFHKFHYLLHCHQQQKIPK